MTTFDQGLPLSHREGWKSLLAHRTALTSLNLPFLFADDPFRADHMNASGAGLFFDYSKNRITKGTLELLLALARECHLPERIEQMFAGEKINPTENRAVLHVALRMPRDRSLVVDMSRCRSNEPVDVRKQ